MRVVSIIGAVLLVAVSAAAVAFGALTHLIHRRASSRAHRV
jgi:hypothetical protein